MNKTNGLSALFPARQIVSMSCRAMSATLTLMFFLAACAGQAALPDGWIDADIGLPSQPGSASVVNGAWTVSGSGADIWTASDQFNFAYTTVSGDKAIVAKVTSLQNTDAWAKGGLMFRNDNTPGAMFVDLVVSAASGISLQWRSATGGDCGYVGVAGAAPIWIKLVRSGNDFTGYYSNDGTTWLQVAAPVSVAMGSAALVGLAVTSHNDGILCQAGFTDVSLSGDGVVSTANLGVYRELWTGLDFSGGNSLAGLTNNPAYPDSPNAAYTRIYQAFEAESNIGMDNYGQRLRAFIVPPTNGDYTFWVSSDDASQLFLSSDESPSNMVPIASVNTWTPSRVWTSEPNQQSAPITLEAKRRYYLEGIMQQGNGGDNFAVRWQMPNGNFEEPIPASGLAGIRLLPFDGKVTKPGIYQQSTNVSVTEGMDASFYVLVTNSSPVSYQWRLNGTNLAGAKATKPTYTLSSVTTALNGQILNCLVSNSLGMVTSAPITLAVSRDLVPPAIVQALNIGVTNVLVVFTKPVELASATNIANYVFTDGSLVKRVFLSSDYMTVTLVTAPLTMGSNYTIVVNGVRDRAAQPNTIATNSQVSLKILPYALQDIGNPAVPATLLDVNNGVNFTASGSDIGGIADQFNFGYQIRTGDFDVSVQLSGLDVSDVWAKAGLMVRETLSANSRFAAALATPAMSGSFFEWRDPAASASLSSGNLPVNFPNTWLRMKRTGNTFAGYASYDGQTWTLLGSAIISMPNQIYFGLALSSHDSTQTTTAQFRGMTDMSGPVITGTIINPHEPLGPSSRKTPIVFSEIMYKPAPRSDSNNVEFLEIYNSNPFFHDIGGYRIVGNTVDYTFPAGTIIQGGAFMVVAASPEGMQKVYGLTNVSGPYKGSLKKADTIQLLDEVGAVLLTVPYSNLYPWPVAADGAGHSMILANPTYGEEDPRAWDISDLMGGSPGGMDAFHPSPLRAIVINELLAHTEDASVLDFLELYNHGNQTNDLSGCVLTDVFGTNKFVVPAGTFIRPHSFVSFDQSQLGFSLSAKGETVYLIQPDGKRVVDAVQYEAQADGVSYGRWPDGANAFYPLSSRTPGSGNSPVLIRDIVINELMYNPISGNDDDQYIELYNKGTNTVRLDDWRFVSDVAYTFPTNVTIAPDSYVVVARNPANLFAKYTNLNVANTFGGYSGKLSHNGARVALAMPEVLVATNALGAWTTNTIHVVVDEVSYGTGGKWGQWSSGGGSSLELIDPNSNHRLAANWADSDDTQKSSWTNIETTGVLDNGANLDPAIDFAQVGLLDAGECLIDNVEVNYNGVNYVSNPTFESGSANWVFEGCFVRSSLENAGYSSARSLHIRCSDRMWTGVNSCGVTLNNTSLQPGQIVTLRFKARWLHGWPEALLRLSGNWLEAAGAMPVPQNLGTPGMRNSQRVTNAGPALYEVFHSPALPAANQPAVVTAQVHDSDGVSTLNLYYRIEPQTTYTAVAMKDDGNNGDDVAGDGRFSATIPGQGAGTIAAFYVAAVDSKGASTRFPALLKDNSPVREAVVMFGDGNPGGSFGVYHLWITQASSARWSALPNLSNEAHDCTIVNGKRVIYNAQARFAGSPYHQGFNTPDGNLCHYKWIFPDDDKFLGATSFNKIHQPGNGAGDDASLQREQVANSLLRSLGVPWLYRRDVVVYVNGNRRGQIMEDAQTPDSDVVKEHFPKDKDGYLYKMQPWFEFGINNPGPSCNFNMPSWCNIMPYTTTDGIKKVARYRYDFLTRRSPDSFSNYTNVFAVVDAASSYGTPNYVANMKSQADMENWLRVFAANHAAGNWDAFGCQNAQNLYGYVGAKGTKYTLLMFDFNISLGNSGSWGPGANLFAVNGADPNVGNIYNEPEFRRMYWRALQELVNGPLDISKSGPLIDAKYKALLANNITPENSSILKNWISAAHDSIASQIAAENTSVFTVNPPVVSNNVAYVTGTAPVGVKTIWINGVEYLVRWTSVQNWQVAVGLQPGTNTLSVTGVDLQGKMVPGATNSIAAVYKGAEPSPVGQVVINEIMVNPTVPGAQYVELYNTSTNVTFDLSTWQLRGLSYTFPEGSLLAPRSYLLLVANPIAFAAAYGLNIPFFDSYDGALQLDGETLSLVQPGTNSLGDVFVSRVRYESTAPWPTNGTGASLQLIDSRQDNWRVGNWAVASTNAAPAPQWVYVSANIGSPVSASTTFYLYLKSAGDIFIDDLKLVRSGLLTSVLQNGDFETALSAPWNVSANFNQSAISTSIKHAGNSSLHLVAAAAGAGSGNSIYQSLTALDTGSTYVVSFWYLQSTNGGPLTMRFSQRLDTELDLNPAPTTAPAVALLSPGAANSVTNTLAQFPSLWLNELQTDNLTGPTNSAGERTAWLELYNPSTNTLSLSGLFLANGYTNLAQWPFPSNSVITAGQFLVVFADGKTNLSTSKELHANFVLPSGAGSLALSRIASNSMQVLDYVNYTNLHPNRSYGSYPDGQSFSRQEFFYVSPGRVNDDASAPLTVAINEWMAGNTNTLRNPIGDKFDDWFELYNYGTNTVDLTGYYLTHSLTNLVEFKIPAGYTIPPQGFLLVWADKKTNTGTADLHADFKLSKSGTSIGLYGADGRPVDYVTFGPQDVDVSMGRYPDGDQNISTLPRATPRTNNAAPAIAPGTPENLSALPGNGKVALSWNAVASATNYIVKRATTDGGPYASIGSGAATAYMDGSVVNGTMYYYVVSAVNEMGEGANSAQVSATPAITAPPAPVELSAIPGNGQVALSWSGSLEATNYLVKRGILSGGPYTVVGSGAASNYVDRAVINGTAYYYVVSALNEGGESANSAQVNAVPQVPAPAIPTGLAAVAGDLQVTLNWNAAIGATNYYLKRATINGGPYAVVASVSVTNYVDSAVTNGTKYFYVVSASNGGGESGNSSQASATPYASLLLDANMTQSGDQISLSWPGWAADYNLYATTNLLLANWQAVTNVPQNSDGVFRVVLPTASARQFFQLKKP